MRAVIYARYSSDNQREASIDDQVRMCREYAKRLGWNVTETFNDAEMTGRTAFRPGLQKMLAAAERRLFDVVVTENVDRLSRRVADLASMYDDLAAVGIKIHSVQLGEISDMHVSIMGMVAQQYSKDLAHKTRRGQSGRIGLGKAAGGLSFGYRVLPPTMKGKISEAGDREINHQEAATVRRVFEMYARGMTPEAIVRQLNSEKVPGPKGRLWRNTTLRGQAKRGTGILRNELYVGRLVWGRANFIRLPKTGKRVARLNDKSQVQVSDVPHLRIVSDELWNKVQARLADVGGKAIASRSGDSDHQLDLNATHRPKSLLSGLLVCSICGGRYIITGKDRYGCANFRRGTAMCSNAKTITRQQVEERVLGCLRTKLMAPDKVKTFMAELQQQIKSANQDAAAKQAQLKKRLAETIKAIAHMVDMVEAGQAPTSIVDRLREREADKAHIEAELAALPPDSNVIAMMPDLSELYARKVATITESLNDPAIKGEATEVIRRLVQKIVLIPDASANDGVHLEVHGALAEILSLAAGKDLKKQLPGLGGPGSQLSVVAGRGYRRYLHLDHFVL